MTKKRSLKSSKSKFSLKYLFSKIFHLSHPPESLEILPNGLRVLKWQRKRSLIEIIILEPASNSGKSKKDWQVNKFLMHEKIKRFAINWRDYFKLNLWFFENENNNRNKYKCLDENHHCHINAIFENKYLLIAFLFRWKRECVTNENESE